MKKVSKFRKWLIAKLGGITPDQKIEPIIIEQKNEVLSSCANCWFYVNGQCTYVDNCTGSKKWSNTFNSFVPVTYQEKTYLEWK